MENGPSADTRMPCTVETFDEAAYLSANPDVNLAVMRGHVPSGRAHWEAHGQAEGRQQSVPGRRLLPYTLVDAAVLPDYAALSEEYPDSKVPPLDRTGVDEATLSWDQLHWRRFGYLVLPGIIPQAMTQAYLDLRERTATGLGGFENSTHAGTHTEILDIGCYGPLAEKITELLGEELFFNFSLTQFTSTERDWHQDDYLGGPETYARYCAAWIAIDDVHPDSGVFELIPGSHRWPGIRGHLVKQLLLPEAREWLGRPGEAAHWCTLAEPFTTPAMEAEIARQGIPPLRFHPRRGDVLLWHGRLMHRGTRPAQAGMRRPALITHYFPQDQAPGREMVRHKGGGLHLR